MLKKRWPKALIIIFLLWSTINIYFYFQHRVSVTVIDIPGWEIDVNNNKTMQIKQVRIYDWEQKEKNPQIIWDRWQSVLLLGNVLPSEELRFTYFSTVSKILNFYSTPYKKLEDSRRIEVSGVIISSGNHNELRPWIQILVNDNVILGDSYEFQTSSRSNVQLFTKKGIVDNIDQEIDSVVLNYTEEFDMDNPNLQTISFRVAKDAKRNYSFFNPVPSKYSFWSPRTSAWEFINKFMYANQQSKAMISRDVIDFPWNNMIWREKHKNEPIVYFIAENYLGDYKTYRNVFVVDVAYKFTDEENNKQSVRDDDIDATQVFYVIEEEGQWKIIDVSPLSKIAKAINNETPN